MLCANAAYRLAAHSNSFKRSLLSVLGHYQHDAFQTSCQLPVFTRGQHFKQKHISNSRNMPKKMTKPQQLRPVILKDIFKDDETPVQSVRVKQPWKETEENPPSVVMLNSESMTGFESNIASRQDLVYSHDDWNTLETKTLAENPLLKKSWQTLCMQLMYHYGQVKLASSLLDYLQTNAVSPNITTLSLFVALQGKHGTEEKEQIIQDAYTEMLKITDVFDSITAKYLIAGLSMTSLWRITLDLLEMVKLTTSPGRACYSPIIAAAIREQDIQLAFELLDELTVNRVEPQGIVLQQVLHSCKSGANHDLLEKYFAYMWKYNWMLSPEMAKEVEQYFSGSLNEKWTCKWTSVNTVRGDCHQCRHQLNRIEVSTSDFEALQRDFLEWALVGSNVYLQSRPQEVERFKDYVMENAPFDVVLDALNIALKGQAKTNVRKSKQLRDMVHYFARVRHMKVLVIGRSHMETWSPADMAYIKRHAKMFFTENISADDPFCLYATLYSGKDCLFVSGDFMRNHKYNLGPRFKETFERWQKSRQILNFMIQSSGVSVVMPSQFDCGPVKDSKGWHIPYNDGAGNLRSETQSVLCLRYKGARSASGKAKERVLV